MKSARELLKEYFGYDSFRKSQEEIIENISSGKDVLAIMPTGGGKSICYQIPALMLSGVTIVISPLISLMKDQVDNINEVGINAAYINSSIDNEKINEILVGAREGKYKIIYLAPERLQSESFLREINRIEVSQVAVDEAHCVSQWGHDFRKSYRFIKGFINSLPERPVVSAFTATATLEVKEDIINVLELNKPEVFISGFNRENLSLNVLKGVNKDRYLFNFLEKNKGLSGIIYCSTRKEVEKVYEKIREKGHKAAKYHAGMSNEERVENQEDFVYDRVDITVATNAFGMGIDKSDIRFVIHYNMPQNIEGYYQEIGRAGRDGEPSECTLLFNPSDIQVLRYIIENSLENPVRKQNQYNKLQSMIDYVYNNECYRAYILKYFGEESINKCDNCSNCNNEGEVEDKTIDAQKVISCIWRMKKPFGTTMIIDVLRASKNQKLLSFGFDELSTYGIMKDCKKEELKDFINTLIAHGFLDLSGGEYPVVIPNSVSAEILKGEKKVLFKTQKKTREVFKGNELFTLLKEIRYELAREENIPPYMVFSDGALLEMSNRYPRTNEEFLDISGVGQRKLEKYGEKFIEAIKDYTSKEKTEVEFVFKEENEKDTSSKKASSEVYEIHVNTDEFLLKELFEVRRNLAKKTNTPPQNLIKLNSLKEISARYPSTIEEIKDISGMGPKKVTDFGEDIIAAVEKYKVENSINNEFEFKNKAKVIVDGERRKDSEIAIDKLRDGMEISEISKEIEVSASTIMGYLGEYLSDGNEVDFNVNYKMYFVEDYHRDVMEAINKLGHEKISLLKKELPDYIPYEAIRASILNGVYSLK